MCVCVCVCVCCICSQAKDVVSRYVGSRVKDVVSICNQITGGSVYLDKIGQPDVAIYMVNEAPYVFLCLFGQCPLTLNSTLPNRTF